MSLKQLKREAELLDYDSINLLPPQRKLCAYKGIIISVLQIAKAIIPFAGIRIAIIGAIAVLQELCPDDTL